MAKYKAVRIDTEYQDSNIYLEEMSEDIHDKVAIAGNKSFIQLTFPVFDKLMLDFDRFAYGIDEYHTLQEWISDYGMYPQLDSTLMYSTGQKSKIKKLCERYRNEVKYGSLVECSYQEILCEMLEMMTYRKWKCRTIRGFVQSDWNIMFYREDLGKYEIDRIERLYFNSGEEFLIYEEGNEYPVDRVYLIEWNYENELAEYLGCSESDITWENVSDLKG